jgi:uncharacterized protein
MYERNVAGVLRTRLREPRHFIQALIGPRQTGKTTLARQVMSDSKMISQYASADEPTLKDRVWVEQQWDIARSRLAVASTRKSGLLVLDEIQKVQDWSETVKRLWDEDTNAKLPLHVVILGSSQLLLQQGLSESLAGRFEIIPVTHWSFREMKEAFGWSLEQYLYFGGYPGAATLIEDENRWKRYIVDALIETTLSRDILLMTRVDKPALLRRLFKLACVYSGQVLSYQKMLGRLQDAGNTTTLAHYLNLLRGAGLVMGLSKYAGQALRQRASSPKLQVLNTALMTSLSPLDFEGAKRERDFWGRLVESSAGSALANSIRDHGMELFYWSHRNMEVDFVLARGNALTAIEVKSGRRKATLAGMNAFSGEFKVKKKLLVGGDGIPLEEFLLTPAADWFR